jgi:hypothetical protein
MKFLISDYSSHWSTEPYYFNAGLNSVGIISNIWNKNASVYDNFDTYKPDVFIGHASDLSKDLISYLKENLEIKIALNINGAEEKHIEAIENMFETYNIKCLFFGANEVNCKKMKFVKILHAADLFMTQAKKQFNIDKAIFVDKKEQMLESNGTYHYLTTNPELGKDVDIFYPIVELNRLFPSYDEIIFRDPSYIESQIAFDAIKSGVKVIFDLKDSASLDKINELFKGEKFFASIKTRHSCFHRLKSLVSQLSYPDIVNKINEKINKI